MNRMLRCSPIAIAAAQGVRFAMTVEIHGG